MTGRDLRHRASALLVAGAIVLSAVGCTDREASSRANQVPPTSPTALADVPPEIERLEISIANGQFSSDVYALQPGVTTVIVRTQGGPYTVAIDRLLQPREVAANAETEIHLNATETGEYTMKLTGQADDTAVLNVRPIGGR